MDVERAHRFFTDDQVRTLALLAPQIASSIENARLYEELAERERRIEEDLKAAHELQSLLLPTRAPEFQGLEVAVGLRPARGISGDIYDFFEEKSDHHTVLAFGDVSGKGAAAALYGALVAGLLRTLAPGKRSPAGVLRAVNEALIERKVEARYVTLLVMLWHPHSGMFSMANAGALPPMVCRDGEIIKLKVKACRWDCWIRGNMKRSRCRRSPETPLFSTRTGLPIT
jgi:sigma-B regulation protein RsbU (phosphoserine phosphatase)